jgi:hypothetical protein
MLRPALALAALALGISGLVATPAAAADPPVVQIAPHQFFSGQVNGTSDEATVTVICVGPSATGHPQAGQTIGVVQVPVPSPIAAAGYTGDAATSIAAGRPDLPATTAAIAVFTVYETQALSTKITLPCGGTVTIVFMPSPNVNGRGSSVLVHLRNIGW